MTSYMASRGFIVVRLTHMEGRLLLQGATVEILNRGEKYITDKNGTVRATVPAPNKSLSLTPNPPYRPYAVYDLRITMAGYVPITVYGLQVFDGIESLAVYDMVRADEASAGDDVVTVPPHGLFSGTVSGGGESAATVFAATAVPTVKIPQNITVHLGPPGSDAVNVTVPFIDYVKSVASSEIYPTWPENSLIANINAEVTFVLNRVYTEWYPAQGYDFDVSASPAFDQYYVHRREIFGTIDRIVDMIFDSYIAREGFIEPIFAQFCDGVKSACTGLSQWGTVDLANQGYVSLEIVRYYYGQNIEIRQGNTVTDDMESYPGTPLSVGSSGEDVLQLQNRLNRIAINYPAIPFITLPDGVYNEETETTVRAFQQTFGLPQTGAADEDTWYRIIYIYNAVKRLGELESEGEEVQSGDFPGNDLVLGDRGPNVLRIEWYINAIARSGQYPQVPVVTLNGVYDSETASAVQILQQLLGLPETGEVDEQTWNALTRLYEEVENTSSPGGLTGSGVSGWPRPYPGTPVRRGDRGDSVYYIQELLGVINRFNSAVPAVEVDGIFGPDTRDAVYAFQSAYGLTVDGIVGALTWEQLNAVYGEAEDQLPSLG